MGRGKRDKQKQIEERRNQRKKDKQMKKGWRKKMGKGNAWKLQKAYIQYYEQFDKEIAGLKIKLRDVGGDGNCLFRSLADQVDGNQTTHFFMREQACKHILTNQQYFAAFIDEDEEGTVAEYVNEMRKNGEWGGHLQLQALSQCFRCIIVVHKKGLQQFYITPLTQEPEGGIFHLAYFQHEDFEHYVSIRQINDDSDLPAINKLQNLNNNMYRHLLADDPEQLFLMKQIQQIELAQKMEKMQPNEEEQEQEPYPNYPKNKKCKCGSKQPYKNCCFKQYQKRLARKNNF